MRDPRDWYNDPNVPTWKKEAARYKRLCQRMLPARSYGVPPWEIDHSGVTKAEHNAIQARAYEIIMRDLYGK
jgi:hypothetical protein